MSSLEFEAYLALLTRFLRLRPAQRESIRRELRAHLEEALEEALRSGANRDEAIRRALNDFGDAAELAQRFRAIGRGRRLIMHSTLTAGLVAASVGLMLMLSPQSTPRVNADSPKQTAAQPAAPAADDDALIRQRLARRMEDVSIENAPLDQVLANLQAELDVNVHVQWTALDQAGVSRDVPVSLKVHNVPFERVLRLVLASQGDVELGFAVQDGVLVISTREALDRELTTRVYDVRDLLSATRAWQTALHAAKSPADASAPPAEAEPPSMQEAADRLMEALQATAEPDAWDTQGGAARMQVLNGVLIVRANSETHAQLDRLLKDLRTARANEPPEARRAATGELSAPLTSRADPLAPASAGPPQ